MFVERKLYPLGNNKNAVSYEIVDDYQTRIQLPPEQAETLLQWLTGNALQIRHDVQGDPLDAPFEELSARWKQPKTTEVYLRDGNIIETEINGKTMDGSSGYILIEGKDINVDLIDGRWQESKRGKGWK